VKAILPEPTMEPERAIRAGVHPRLESVPLETSSPRDAERAMLVESTKAAERASLDKSTRETERD
jgi:hypothetical protein